MPHLLEGRLRLQYPNDVIGIHSQHAGHDLSAR